MPGWPIKSIVAVNYKGTDGIDAVMSSVDYVLSLAEPVRIEADAWPSTSTDIGSVWIDYVVGEASASDVREDLRNAIRASVQQQYDIETFGQLQNFKDRVMARYRRGMSAA